MLSDDFCIESQLFNWGSLKGQCVNCLVTLTKNSLVFVLMRIEFNSPVVWTYIQVPAFQYHESFPFPCVCYSYIRNLTDSISPQEKHCPCLTELRLRKSCLAAQTEKEKLVGKVSLPLTVLVFRHFSLLTHPFLFQCWLALKTGFQVFCQVNCLASF